MPSHHYKPKNDLIDKIIDAVMDHAHAETGDPNATVEISTRQYPAPGTTHRIQSDYEDARAKVARVMETYVKEEYIPALRSALFPKIFPEGKGACSPKESARLGRKD